MKHIYITAIALLFFNLNIFAQTKKDSTLTQESVQDTTLEQEHIKKGFSLGILPALSYDSDLGFLYGIIVNLYDFGDGSGYPNYDHSLYIEWSRTTKGTGKNQIVFDSRKLIKGIRTTAEIGYFTEKAIGFYGFNGREAEFNKDYADENSADYKTRMYYRHERQYLVARADFQGNIIKNKLRWMAGFSHNRINVGSVDVDNLNKGQDAKDTLPHVNSLYDDYVDWNIIKKGEINGGYENQVKFGLMYDTRDNEANPMKGIWDEVLIVTSPSFLGNDVNYTKLVLTHHQYFTIIKKKMNFAYRLSYQPKIAGTIPFYSLPFVRSSTITRDGLGGSKTLRGIYRNRIVGDDLFFANFEVRWKFYNAVVFNQNLYIALFPYLDMGMVTKSYSIDLTDVPEDRLPEFQAGKESLHYAYGAGLAFALNHNFIINFTYGMSNSVYDGRNSMYITLNFLF